MMAELLPVWPLFAMMAGIVAIMILAAVVAHPYRRELMVVGENLIASPLISKREKAGLDIMLKGATSFWAGFLFVILPAFFLADLARGRVDMSEPPAALRSDMGRLTSLLLISVFAANPFVGMIWAPLYAVLLAAARLAHLASTGYLIAAFSKGAKIRHAVHL